jgi:hypothetical protein
MPKDNDWYEQDNGKNAPYRSARRDSRRPKGRGRDRRISVRSIQRDQPDVRKLARAVIQLALAQAEAEAQAKDRDPTSPQENADES